MCPKCGGPVHRSRTRGFGEKLVKMLSANRTYRCFECGWRGWLEATDISQLRETRRRRLVRTIISVLVTILITALFALYLVRKTHAEVLTELKANPSKQTALFHKVTKSSSLGMALGFPFTLIPTLVFCNNGCPARFFEVRCFPETHPLMMIRRRV